MNLSPHIVRELQYFVGKVCTVVTPCVTGNIPMNDKRFVDFFVGRVDAVNEQCIWVSHLVTGTKSVFFDVVALAEEQVVGPDHPDYDKLKPQPKLDVAIGDLEKQAAELRAKK